MSGFLVQWHEMPDFGMCLTFPPPSPFLSSSPLPLCYNKAPLRPGNKADGCSTECLALRTWECGNHLINMATSEYLLQLSPLLPSGQTTAGGKRRNDGQWSLLFGLDWIRAIGWAVQEHQPLPLIQTQRWKGDGCNQQLGGHFPDQWFLPLKFCSNLRLTPAIIPSRACPSDNRRLL